MTLLLVGAEEREFAGVNARAGRRGRLRWPVRWAGWAEYGGRRLLLVANGAGARRAAAGTAAALARERPAALISIGFCGALDPALAPGDVFAATEVVSGGRRWSACLPRAPRPFASGVLVSRDDVAATAAEKAALRATGAAAVEMEAAGVAEQAATASLPFYCIRAVTDLAGESFAVDYNSILRAAGYLDTMLLLGHVVRRPAAALPELVRLWRRSRLAAGKLGEFIGDCRF